MSVSCHKQIVKKNHRKPSEVDWPLIAMSLWIEGSLSEQCVMFQGSLGFEASLHSVVKLYRFMIGTLIKGPTAMFSLFSPAFTQELLSA